MLQVVRSCLSGLTRFVGWYLGLPSLASSLLDYTLILSICIPLLLTDFHFTCWLSEVSSSGELRSVMTLVTVFLELREVSQEMLLCYPLLSCVRVYDIFVTFNYWHLIVVYMYTVHYVYLLRCRSTNSKKLEFAYHIYFIRIMFWYSLSIFVQLNDLSLHLSTKEQLERGDLITLDNFSRKLF